MVAGDGDRGEKEILLDMSKKEQGNPSSNFKKFHRRLKTEYKVAVNKELITPERLASANCLIIAGPREMFSSDEFNAIKDFVANGGALFILLGEGGEGKCGTNINYLLEDFGMMVNTDAVVRTVYHKYHHPK